MRGRQWFSVAAWLLNSLAFVLQIVPRLLLVWCWPVLDIFPGLVGAGLRYVFAKRLAAGLGTNVFFGRGVEVKGWDKLVIGSNVSFHKDCYVDASGGISVGNDVSVAHGSSLLSFEHQWSDSSRPIRDNPCSFAKVTIHNDVWIGCGCRVLSGVEICSRTVIAAGAVVTKSIDGKAIFAGIPARKVSDL